MRQRLFRTRPAVHPFAEPRKTSWVSYGLAIAAIAVATVVGAYWVTMPDPRNLSLLFFAAVLGVGLWLGLRPALCAALLAFFSYNFFLIEPRFRLHFAPADFLAFVSFLIGALIVGGLSGRLSDRARDATDRLRDLSVLFQASRELSDTVEQSDAARRLARRLEDTGCDVAIWLQEHQATALIAASPGAMRRAADTQAEIVALLNSDRLDDVQSERWLIRLEASERTIGALAIWPGANEPKIRIDRRWIDAVLELGAIAIDRARLINEVAQTTIVAEKEGLRTALLSSLSHDLRTPLSTILASATALQAQGDSFDDATKHEMLETIQDESNRLNRYVANLLEMTRLESGALQVRSVLIDPSEALSSAIDRMASRLKDRRLLRTFEAHGRILVDPVLLEQALINVLENAAVYSPPGSTLALTTAQEHDQIVLAVEDEGPGIAAEDLERIFDKFFRGRSDRRQGAGVGLGLSVARGLVEAFGGTIRAVPGARGRGARMEIRLRAYPVLEPVE
jgi:two-component system sensor histidine kinase KdpD